ncbi:MAG: DoxX family membrane protein [Spirosomaceae bacterium]|jgi:uncharacterized membrane protein YphA (DoxX/SURF4 family)|nr:DoxX family membrane protein [Spirosomataceae bacterium]
MLVVIGRCFLGILFLVSGVLKAVDTAGFARNLSEYGFGYADFFAFSIVGIEIVIGLCWLMDINTKLNSHFTLWMTLAFTGVLIYGKMNRGIEDCGCMGDFVEIPFEISIARNIVIMLLSLWLIVQTKYDCGRIVVYKIYLLILLSCLGFGLAGLTTGVELYAKHSIRAGQRVEDTFLAQFREKLSGKRAFAFVFSPSCSHCWNASENVKSIRQYPELGEVIGVISEDTDAVDYIEMIKPNFEIFSVKTDLLKNNVKGVPLLVEFRDGKVAVIHKSGHIPTGAYLKQFSK